jgi:hypothetical protein
MAMLFRYLILLTIFAAVGVPCAAQSQPFSTPEKGVAKQESGKSTENSAASDKEKNPAPNVTVIVNQEKPAAHKSDESKNSEDIKIQRELAKFTGGLVVVGLIQAGILALTLVMIAKQASLMAEHAGHLRNLAAAADKNAAAALLNAQAIMNSERAWMAGLNTPQKFTSAPEVNENIVYFCKITNAGRTASRILEVRVAFRKIATLDQIPPEPTYQKGEIFPFNKIVVVPNDYIPMSTALFPPLFDNEYSAIRDRKLFTYGYGYVRYLDIFSKNDEDFRETRFCHYYFISTPGDVPTEGFTACIQAPAKYHEAT